MCDGVTHTLGGALLWLGGTWVATARFGVDISPAAVGVGTVLTMGAALLPDTDHPDSAIAHAVPPVSKVVCREVSKVFHHRAETHYLVSVPAWAALVGLAARARLDVLEPPARLFAEWWPTNGALAWVHDAVVRSGSWQLGLFLVVALLTAWGLRLIDPQLDRSFDGAGEIVVGVAVAAVAFLWVPMGPWVPAAVAVGVLSHDLEDLLTKGPFRFLWPLPWRFSLGWFTTGHAMEHVVVGPVLLVAVTALMWVRSVQPVALQLHAALSGF